LSDIVIFCESGSYLAFSVHFIDALGDSSIINGPEQEPLARPWLYIACHCGGNFNMLNVTVRVLVLMACFGVSQVWASDKAPFRDLVDIDGKPVTTQADVGNGKWQVVMIWATDCHICSVMKPKMSAFHDKHKDTDAQVYGVALDGPAELAAVQKYMIDHKVTFPTYIGDINLIAVNFEINHGTALRGTPTYLLFNPAGEMVAIDFGMLDVDAIERFMDRNT